MYLPSIRNTLIYYSALILNIFLGWLLTKINTGYLEVPAYGQYIFFISFLLIAKSFFSFGFFESISRLIAVSKQKEVNDLYGTGLIWALIFGLLATIVIYISGYFIDSVFRVKIGFLCQKLAYGIGLYLVVSYLSLALRGSGKIKTLSFVTIMPRIIYLLLLL